MQQELTVIIPFLNEGVEVFNTVESIRNTSEGAIIILINDAATDNYDYRSVAEKFDAVYIEHSERKGVAASRDEGVHLCQTEYFILLDAHMRFYQTDWVPILLQAIDSDRRAIYCCQTAILRKQEDGTVYTEACTSPSGAYVPFSSSQALNRHTTVELDPSEFFEDIDEQVLLAFRRAPLQSFRADAFLSPGLYYLVRRRTNSLLTRGGFPEQLIDYTLKLIEAKTEAAGKGVPPHEPYFACSLLFLIEQLADDDALKTRLLSVFRAASSYLQVLLPLLPHLLDKYLVERLMSRVVAVGYDFPEWAQGVHADAVIRELETIHDKELFQTASRIAICDLVFEDVVDKEISRYTISRIIDTMIHKAEWEKAFYHFDNENLGLEGMAGLALLMGSSNNSIAGLQGNKYSSSAT